MLNSIPPQTLPTAMGRDEPAKRRTPQKSHLSVDDREVLRRAVADKLGLYGDPRWVWLTYEEAAAYLDHENTRTISRWASDGLVMIGSVGRPRINMAELIAKVAPAPSTEHDDDDEPAS